MAGQFSATGGMATLGPSSNLRRSSSSTIQAGALSKLYEAIAQAQKGTTQTTTRGTTPELQAILEQVNKPQVTTEKTQYGISPEVLKYITEAQGQIQGLAAKDPYAEMYQAYNDVLSQLGQSYASRGSRTAAATRQSALSTGLTPLEATSLGEESWMEALRQYYQQMPELRLQQEGLQQKRWQDLAGLQTQYNQLAGVAAGASQPIQTTRTQPLDVASIIQALTQLAPTTTTQTGDMSSIIQALVSILNANRSTGGGGGGTQATPSVHYTMGPYAAVGGTTPTAAPAETPTAQPNYGFSSTDLDYLLKNVFGGQG